METRGVIAIASWFTAAVISTAYLLIGGVTLFTGVATALLVGVAFVVTFGVGFGMVKEFADRRQQDQFELKLMGELSEQRKMVEQLFADVAEIKRELQE